eukprot:3696745-Karenia_brevis.AAC.1
MDPDIEREIEILMQETRAESAADAYETAYDTLAHDLLRDEWLRKRGVEKSDWPYEFVDGVK